MIKTTVSIEGMMCSGCEARMSRAITEVFDVKEAESSAEANRTVILSEKSLDADILKETVEKTGYTFVSAEEETE